MNLLRMLALAVAAACALAQTPTGAGAKKSAKESDKEIKLGEDEPGCKDSALFARIAGCSIIQCDTKEADSVEMQIGVSTDGVVQKEGMDGPSEVLYYLCPTKVSLAHIVKSAEAALVKSGFKTVYSGKDDDDQPLVTVLKDTQWVQISTYMYNEYSAYIQAAVKVPPESQATSEAIADEIEKNGRFVLSGLTFEAQKAALPTEAEKVLSEVAAFLVRQPNLKIRVEVHATDAGDSASNVRLSKERAAAVAGWLLEHGIDKTRVSIDGFSDGNPDGSPGLGQSQRIEIVKL